MEKQVQIVLQDTMFPFAPDSTLSREFTFTVPEETGDEVACEMAFHITNAPESMLSSKQLAIVKQYRPRRSLSVGDVVTVGDNTFMCMSAGWKKLTKSSD
jgi:hypothetical protein